MAAAFAASALATSRGYGKRGLHDSAKRAAMLGAKGRGARCCVAAMRGFSVLEVLVAFVILALVGTSLFGLFSGALMNIAAAEDYSRAVLVAQSVLSETSATLPLREGSNSGTADDGRISWSTQVGLYTSPSPNPDMERLSEAMVTRLWQIAAEVTFTGSNGKPRTLKLTTVRLGAKDSR